MVADLLRWGGRIVPDSRLLVERLGGTIGVRAVRSRLLTGGVIIFAVAAVAFATITVLRHEQQAKADRAAALRAEAANAALQGELDRLRDRLGADRQALTSAQTRLSALNGEARSKQQQLTVTEEVSSTKADRIAQLARELHLSEAQRATLLARLSKAEADAADRHSRQHQAAASLEEVQRKAQELATERDRVVGERDRLKARIAELEHRLSMAQPVTAPTQPQTGAPAATAPTAGRQAVLVQPSVREATTAPARIAPIAPQAQPAVATGSRGGWGGIAQIERVLGSAGVDVAHLFSQYGLRSGEGGPFIPVSHGQQAADSSLSAEKLAALAKLVKSLPISAPLESYHVGSPFGAREDPINGHEGYHTGIDLLAAYMTPVYATAAGVVTYSGYRDDYGKVVEIDHGNGLTTRYAHLHRQTVSVGQHVAPHQQIGFLGSTGRATGPHVHYEVLVNGEPQDPAKFMALAHVMTAAVQR